MGKRSTPTRLKRMSQADSSVPPEAVPPSTETEPIAAATQEEVQSTVLAEPEVGNGESSPSPNPDRNQQNPQETAACAELEVEAAKELFAKIVETASDSQDAAASAYSALLAYHTGAGTTSKSETPAIADETAALEPQVKENETLDSIQSDTKQEGSEPVKSKSEQPEVPVDVVESSAIKAVEQASNAQAAPATVPTAEPRQANNAQSLHDAIEVQPDRVEPVQDAIEIEISADQSIHDAVEIETEASESPIHDAVEIETNAAEPIHDAVEIETSADQPVHNATEIVPSADQPVHDATEIVPSAAQPVHNATEIVPSAAQPVHNATEIVPSAAQPVQDAVEVRSSKPVQDLAEGQRSAAEPIHNAAEDDGVSDADILEAASAKAAEDASAKPGNAFDKLRKKSHTADMPAIPKYEATLAKASRKADNDHDNFDPPDDGSVQRITGSDITPLPKTLTGSDLNPLPSLAGEPALHEARDHDSPPEVGLKSDNKQAPPAQTPTKPGSENPPLAQKPAAEGGQPEKAGADKPAVPQAPDKPAGTEKQKVSPFAATQVDGIKPLIEPHKKQSGAGKRTSSEGQPPLVNPFDAHKSGFLDALRKASRNNQTDTSSSTNVSSQRKSKQPPAAKADSGVWKPTDEEQFYSGPSRARGGDTVQMPGRGKGEPQVREEKLDRAAPFKGRQSQDQGPIQRWGHETEFGKSGSVWAEQLGVIKTAPPARASSSSVARNLRRIMSSGIFNVRELYSLRGLACLCVFLAQAQLFVGHAEPSSILPLATIGAQLFFVMSGFFITRTLMVHEVGSLKEDLGNFYAHRALRILPPYFVTLAVLLAWNHLPFAESFFACLFNYKLFELNRSMIGAISQYWTLCIEVQFYLLFPLLLMATPQRLRLTMLTCLTFLSVLATYTSAHTRVGSPDYLLLPICGQFLMIGAIVGYIDSKSEIALRVSGTKFFLTGLALQIGLQVYEVWSHAKLGYWPEILWKDHATVSAISFALIIVGLWRSSSPVLKSLFTTEVLVYFGKISFGFYLMMPVAFILQPAISALDPRIAHVHPIAISFFIASVLAIIGWHYLQLPILNMRGNLPLRPDHHY
jgi:peptidoglycan/LPS O-acetylase OafA/YrhL